MPHAVRRRRFGRRVMGGSAGRLGVDVDSTFARNVVSLASDYFCRVKHEAMPVGRSVVRRDRRRAAKARSDYHVADGSAAALTPKRLREAVAGPRDGRGAFLVA